MEVSCGSRNLDDTPWHPKHGKSDQPDKNTIQHASIKHHEVRSSLRHRTKKVACHRHPLVPAMFRSYL